MGRKAAAKKVFGNDSLQGRRIGVQGVGQVGTHLVELLVKEKAEIFIADMATEKVKRVAREFPVACLEPDEIYDLDMDIFAPCGLGATINDDTIDRLRCSIIAGAANNQLQDETRHAYMLIDRSITYAPDFLINAGGLINVYHEYLGHYNRQRVMDQTEKIYNTCFDILGCAEAEEISSQDAAIKLAEKRISEVGRLQMSR